MSRRERTSAVELNRSVAKLAHIPLTSNNEPPPGLPVPDRHPIRQVSRGSVHNKEPAMNDELVRLLALAIAQAVVDQKASGATFDIESMTIIDAESNRGWEVLPVAKSALKVIEPPEATAQSQKGEPGAGKE